MYETTESSRSNSPYINGYFFLSRTTINNNLADPSSVMKTVEEYIQEELGEFSTSQFKLTQLAAKIKTITCVKGKTTKKVSGLAPECPKGYIKKI